jgi:hypothetical protein
MQLIFSQFIVVATISDMEFLGVSYFVELGVHQINFSGKFCQPGVSQITIQIFFCKFQRFFLYRKMQLISSLFIIVATVSDMEF